MEVKDMYSRNIIHLKWTLTLLMIPIFSYFATVGCTASLEESEDFYSRDEHPERTSSDPMRNQFGRMFLVEQSKIFVNSTMLPAIAEHAPGGILFWNSDSASGAQTREVIREYSLHSERVHSQPLLYSVDYEGGGITTSLSHRKIPGIQRIRTGMTDLAHPAWLGRVQNREDRKLACRLHGAIMADELMNIGINYPLATVSDLRKNLMLVRGISDTPEIVSECIGEILKSFIESKHIVLVTKHFPGLGSVSGDTHDGDSQSNLSSREELDSHLMPFKRLVDFVNENDQQYALSFMSSHAKFPFLDSQHLTTESPTILTELLVKRLGFEGIRVSDAMWMGNYGKLPREELHAVYVNSILAGEDLLMIPGTHFAKAFDYLRRVYDLKFDQNALTIAEKKALESRTGLNIGSARTKLIERLRESLSRQNLTLTQIGYAHSFMGEAGEPSRLTAEKKNEYYRILNEAGLDI